MSKNFLKIFFISSLCIIFFQNTASAKMSVFLDGGATKTSESNANILEATANPALTSHNYYKPSFNDSFEFGTYRFGINYANENDVTIKGKLKVLEREDEIRLSSAGTSESFLEPVDFFYASSAKDINVDIDDEAVVVDVSTGKNFYFLENFENNVSVGLRYADIKREQNRIYQGDEFGTIAAGTHSTSDITEEFTGLGIRLSTEGRYHIAKGIGVFGEAGLALLSGTKKTSKLQTDRQYSESEDLRLEEDEVVTSTDFMIGIDWKKEFSNEQSFSIGVGYEMETWDNAFAHFYNDSDAPVGISHDFSTDTIFLRLSYGF